MELVFKLIGVASVCLLVGSILLALLWRTAHPKAGEEGVDVSSLAEKGARAYIRQATIAAAIPALMTAGGAILILSGKSIEDFDRFLLFDALLSIGLTLGVWRGNRFCAISFLLYFVANRGLILSEGHGLATAVIPLILLGPFLWRGIRGAFVLHRLRKAQESDEKRLMLEAADLPEEPWVPPHEAPAPSPPGGRLRKHRVLELAIALGVAGWLIWWLATDQTRFAALLASIPAETPAAAHPEKLYYSSGVAGAAVMWLFAALILLAASVNLREFRLGPLLPEVAALVLALQGVRTEALPEQVEAWTHRVNEVLALIAMQGGPYLWTAMPALFIACRLSPPRISREPPRFILPLMVATVVAAFLDLGRALLLAAAILLLRTLLLAWRARQAGVQDQSVTAKALHLLASVGLALLCSSDPSRWIVLLAWLTTALYLILAIETLARSGGAQQPASSPAGAIVSVDGRAGLNPFLIPNEARLRVVLALLFGIIGLAFQAQLLGALCAARFAAPLLAAIINALVVAAVILTPIALAMRASRPSGKQVYSYTPADGLAASEEGQFFDESLTAIFRRLLDAWRPGIPFRVFLGGGVGTPITGFGLDGYFIVLPAATMANLFSQKRDAPTLDAQAEHRIEGLLAHELAHIIHGDPLPLVLAASICKTAFWLCLPAGLLLGLSSLSPASSWVPAGQWLEFFLMAALSLLTFSGLLRAAQRKIELLADARAALHLGSTEPVQRMVEALIEEGNRAPVASLALHPFRPAGLGATSIHRSRGSAWQRAITWLIDTHERLDRRLESVRSGLHALNAPDGVTLFLVSALTWVPLLLDEEIALGTWSPTLLAPLLAVAGSIAIVLEYYFLAALSLSPYGASLNIKRLSGLNRMTLLGSATGLGIVGLIKLSHLYAGWDASSLALIIRVVPLSVIEPGDPVLTGDMATLMQALIIAESAALVTGVLLLYATIRWFLLRQLQRLARVLCFAFPKVDPKLLILAPFLGWLGGWTFLLAAGSGLTSAFVPTVLLRYGETVGSSFVGAAAEKNTKGLLLVITAAATVTGVLFAAIFLLYRLALRRVHTIHGTDFDDARMIASLYRGSQRCPLRMRCWIPASSHNESMSHSPGALPIYLAAGLVSLGALFAAVGTTHSLSKVERHTSRELMWTLLEDHDRRHALIEKALLQNLRRRLDVTLDEMRAAEVAYNSKDPVIRDRLWRSFRLTKHANASSPEASQLLWWLKFNPGRLGEESALAMQLHEGFVGGSLTATLATVMAFGRSPAANITQFFPKCTPVEWTTRAAALADAMCRVSIGDGQAALAALHHSFEATEFIEVGPLWALAAIMAHQPTLAVEKVTAYARLCQTASSSCPKKTGIVLDEFVTLAAVESILDARRRTSHEPPPKVEASPLPSTKTMERLFGNQNQAEARRLFNELQAETQRIKAEHKRRQRWHDPRFEYALQSGKWYRQTLGYRFATATDLDVAQMEAFSQALEGENENPGPLRLAGEIGLDEPATMLTLAMEQDLEDKRE